MEKEKSTFTVKDITLIALFTTIISIFSLIVIQFGIVPFTLQTLGIFIAVGVLGTKLGTISVVLYILIGSIGIPVFGGQGGLHKIVGPTGGFIIGFILLSIVTGCFVKASEKFTKTMKVLLVSTGMILGNLVCYATGMIQFVIIQEVDYLTAFASCIAPFIIPDLIKIIIATMVTITLKKRLPPLYK